MHANNRFLSLRLWRNRNLISIRRYGIDVTDRIKVDEDGNIKLRLDPKVEALQEKLIYCDYIDRKRLKYGYGTNKAIEIAIKNELEKERLHKIVQEPTFSIALKYLKNDVDKNEPKAEKVVDEVEEVIETSTKPIYMPYSTTDQFKSVKIEDKNEDNNIQLNTPLDERYKKLYESYLLAKESDDTTTPRKNVEDLKTRILRIEKRKRPTDSITNVPEDWMKDYEQFNDFSEDESWESYYGTSNPDVPVSSIPCGGCGALLQCQDSAIPGYLPSELFTGLNNLDLKNIICQRCHFMKHYNTTLEVTVPPETYPEILSNIKLKKKRAAVILMIDLTDFPCSIWPDLPKIIGKYTPIFVVGNKVDLLPKDCPRFLENIENSLVSALKESGLGSINIKHVALISGKTGYGVERFINKLHQIWEYKGDVYMIGCTNVGKSTLFNALLQSDYCKVQAVDLIQRATISPWPGTTLNLLKFPILNPLRWRLYQRTLRRKAEELREQAEIQMRKCELIAKRDVTLATLQERIGRTFPTMMSTNNNILAAYEASRSTGKFGINENSNIYKNSRWCYDTPGVIHPDQVLHLLTTEELLLTLPKKIISPRTFIFKPGQTMFLAGLGRIDLISGPEFIRITVFASHPLPVTICHTENADYIYNELLHTEALVVPKNSLERLKMWPKLESKEFSMVGISDDESVADVILSSAGWVAMTPKENAAISVRAWTPEGRGIYLRKPALLSKSITHRGARLKSRAAYKYGRQVYTK
ncbi:hypothetical protein PV327_004955 [Microctonus hyperodae]|uniref:Nitric oxide-associated protein 1 n=1 Tax=Microctonus hyperodae TaxID=165561 RepID=A0AA39KNA5_MICHY|nr:hypothetical protein PV327_004955 [Microctonus hyperodae]